MLSKEELLKNYESVRNYWLEKAPEEILCETSKCGIKLGLISTEKALIKESKRFAAISKVGHIVRDGEDYEARINEIVENLQERLEKLYEKSFERVHKEACHWKREGYESREAYELFLKDDLDYPYGWNSDNAYPAEVIKNILDDISQITGEEY